MVIPHCDRHWLLTWTTYGTWLPGDERGFVSDSPEVRHNIPGTPYDRDIPELRHVAREKLVGEPIYLDTTQASVLVAQFQETATHRGWELHAAAAMRNHCHVFVGVPGDPEPDTLLRDFKSYGSRALNRQWPKPLSGTWWTESGSKRKKTGEQEIARAIRYVRGQPHCLALRLSRAAEAERQRIGLGERGA